MPLCRGPTQCSWNLLWDPSDSQLTALALKLASSSGLPDIDALGESALGATDVAAVRVLCDPC